MTTITFVTDRISIQIPSLVDFSESYGAIRKPGAKTGVLEFEFADGKKMTRWCGLSTLERMAGILMELRE